MLKSSFLHAVVSGLLLVGCTAHVRGSASISAPELVYVSPGVQVIADYREPIFYSDRYYWRSSGNVWYRSSTHTGGWVRYQAPSAVLRIERPSAYVHYRGSARASSGRSTPAARDDRKDAKEERKDRREDQKEERKDRRDDWKEDRKDAKKDRK